MSFSFPALFFSLQLTGGIGLLLMMVTAALSSRVERSMGWYNLSLSGVGFSLAYSMLLFAGQVTGPQPDQALCVMQTTLTHASSVFAACANLSFSLDLWLDVRRSRGARTHPGFHALVFIVPYGFLIVDILASTIFAASDPGAFTRGYRVYCTSISPFPTTFAGVINFITGSGACIFQFLLAREVIAVRRKLGPGLAKGYTSIAIRMGLFTLFTITAMAVDVLHIFPRIKGPAGPDVEDTLLALIPLVGVLLFGSQKDFLSCLMFWKPSKVSAVPNRSANGPRTDAC